MKRWQLVFTAILLLLPSLANAAPLNPADDQAVQGDYIFYDSNDAGSGNGGFCGGAGAALSSTVPEPYRTIFAKAAAKANADPALLTTIFLLESGGGSFPDPPPPYGHGAAWRSRAEPESAIPGPAYVWPDGLRGSKGPFQMLYPFWNGHHIDGNGDGVEDVNDLTDAAFAAADAVAGYGGTVGVPFGDASNPKQKPSVLNVLASYNAGPGFRVPLPSITQSYLQIGTRYYTQLTSGSGEAPNLQVNSCGDTVTGNAVLDVALSQVGNGPGGGYLKYSNNRHENWCADFVSWVYKQAGKPFTPENIPAAAGVRDWFKANGVWVDNAPGAVPLPGDVVYYNHQHVNFVVKAEGGSMELVGGNQGNRDYEFSKVTRYTEPNYTGNGDIAGWGRLK